MREKTQTHKKLQDIHKSTIITDHTGPNTSSKTKLQTYESKFRCVPCHVFFSVDLNLFFQKVDEKTKTDLNTIRVFIIRADRLGVRVDFSTASHLLFFLGLSFLFDFYSFSFIYSTSIIFLINNIIYFVFLSLFVSVLGMFENVPIDIE